MLRKNIEFNDLALIEILPLLWVFKYKFDSEGYLLKYKAHICVRGDLQTTADDTHAATLAIRTFRALMAIAAYFNLEVRHYDAVNAFTNAHLLSPVFTSILEGFDDGTHIWELQSALYGLKTSPLLWYKELTSTLTSFGLKPVLDCNCFYTNDKLIVFFYVDDIIVMAKPAHISALDEFERNLFKHYEITNLSPLKTFYGITIARNRESGDIWLSQKDYINAIYHRYSAPKPFNKAPLSPLPLEKLLPSSETKNPTKSHRYSQIVGSIGYAAGATRPDIAKTHSKLAKFLINPSSQHLQAAYQVLAYLYYHQDDSIYYSASCTNHYIDIKDHEEIDFFSATDASYADHKATSSFSLEVL